MQIQGQLAITGYNKRNVETALRKIIKRASNTRSKLDVTIRVNQ